MTCSLQRRYCVQSAKRVDETSAEIRLQGFESICCRDRLSTTSMQLAALCILIQAPKTNSFENMTSDKLDLLLTGVVSSAQIQRNRALRFAPLPCDTLAEWLRRRPAKPMRSPRVGSNPTGVVCVEQRQQRRERHRVDLKPTRTMANETK